MIRVQKIRLPADNDRRERHSDITFETMLATFPWRGERPQGADALLREAIVIMKEKTERRTREHNIRRTQKLRQELVDLQSLSASVVRGVAALPGNQGGNSEKVAAVLAELKRLASPELISAVQRRVAIVDAQLAAMNEIAATAGLLEDQLRAFRSRFHPDPPKTKADVRKYEFVRVALELWEQIAAKQPGATRDGPFAKFCAMAWLECGYPAPANDTLSNIGVVVERVLKGRRKVLAQLR